MKQRPCRSCAAQAAVSSLESCLALSRGAAPVPLSAQQLVDCTLGLQAGAGTELSRQNRGCTDGFPDLHLQYVLETGGELLSAANYPLEPSKANITAADCSAGTRRQAGPRLEDYEFEFFSDEELMQSWVADYGPAITFVDVTPDWQFYYCEST